MPDRRLPWLLAGLLCWQSVLADDFTATASVAARPVQADPYPRTAVAFAEGVRGYPAVVYARPESFRPLTLDLYLPPTSAKPRPLVLFVHGGGWSGGHSRALGALEDFPQVLAGLAAQGYVVASVEYRLSGEAGFPAQLEDIRAAMGWLDGQAGHYGIDRTRVALWGASAGAHLASLAALEGPLPVLVLVGWFGAYDLPALLADPDYPAIAAAAGRLLGCVPGQCPGPLLRQASPSAQVGQRPPASLLIHGDSDRVVPHAQSQAMAEALRRQGAPVQLELMAGVGHSLVGEAPSLTRDSNRRALALTRDFLAHWLGEGATPGSD
ncbi:alpha/beta hydrolase fold domain-containing protein [Pseudomonas sp. ABC1]|uniref:alpha/beta hydrolase fold domain-containing protein n=1 Tax=Pseudomonas sp. ABC1 TaxID=2748080 RepID=UPI0015C3C8BF|nr:alpha/beta hydrolase fold domain-containing protein [Pseudomonas sp. ABC1]QLF94268.1 alpha/beta hydrolase fold domain-containing protein [Pseudomonas sp. ABC1]